MEVGFDAAALCAALEAVATGGPNVHAVLVERQGKLVAELYRTGPDRPIEFLYGLGNPSGKSLTALAREQLFEPLGITEWSWAGDLRARPMPYAGLRLRPRDMLKLGRLAREGGPWRTKGGRDPEAPGGPFRGAA